MGFFDRIRASFARFMSGRYGTDQLNMTMLWTALILSIAGAFFGSSPVHMVLTIIADVMLIIMFVRMLSKDRYKRAQENQLYLQKTQKVRQAVTEWANRIKNRKKYRYFKCPKCRKRLRVPRGVGSITITCRDCGAKFDKKV